MLNERKFFLCKWRMIEEKVRKEERGPARWREVNLHDCLKKNKLPDAMIWKVRWEGKDVTWVCEKYKKIELFFKSIGIRVRIETTFFFFFLKSIGNKS